MRRTSPKALRPRNGCDCCHAAHIIVTFITIITIITIIITLQHWPWKTGKVIALSTAFVHLFHGCELLFATIPSSSFCSVINFRTTGHFIFALEMFCTIPCQIGEFGSFVSICETWRSQYMHFREFAEETCNPSTQKLSRGTFEVNSSIR